MEGKKKKNSCKDVSEEKNYAPAGKNTAPAISEKIHAS